MYDNVKTQNFQYNGRIVYYLEFPSGKHDGCKVHVFYDNKRHRYLQENYFNRLSRANDTDISSEKILQETGHFDVSILLTNRKAEGVSILLNNRKAEPEEIYRDYKSRWEIEEMFDTHKNTLGFNMSYETDFAVQEAWAFIEILALKIFYKMDGILLNGKIKSMNVEALLFRATRITQAKIGDR